MFKLENLLSHPNPPYPPEARRIGLEGRVIISATIDKDGVPRSLMVIQSSNLMFNQPSMDAIQNWRYKRTLLNNEPIDVPTTITVNFQHRPLIFDNAGAIHDRVGIGGCPPIRQTCMIPAEEEHA
jgi:TonB family protein